MEQGAADSDWGQVQAYMVKKEAKLGLDAQCSFGDFWAHLVDLIFTETELKILLSKPAYLKDRSPGYASCDSRK